MRVGKTLIASIFFLLTFISNNALAQNMLANTCYMHKQLAGTMQYQDGIYVLNLNGNYHDMGYCYGKLTAPALRRFLTGIDQKIDFNAPLNRFFIFAERHALPQREQDLLQGIADGSGIDLDDVIKINFSTDLLFVGKHHNKEACSTVMIKKAKSALGSVLVARNYDMPRQFATAFMPYMSIVKYHPNTQDHTVAVVGPLGMISGLSGMNDMGLFNEVNSGLTFLPFPRINPFALPNPMVQNFEALLKANRLEDLYGYYKQHLVPVAVLTGIADADIGYHFERSPYQRGKALQTNEYDQIIRPVSENNNDIFTNTSRFKWFLIKKQFSQQSDSPSQEYLRLSNLQKLVANARSRISVEDLQHIITLPIPQGGAFEPYNVDTKNNNSATAYSLVVSPANKTMWLYVMDVTPHWYKFKLQ